MAGKNQIPSQLPGFAKNPTFFQFIGKLCESLPICEVLHDGRPPPGGLFLSKKSPLGDIIISSLLLLAPSILEGLLVNFVTIFIPQFP